MRFRDRGETPASRRSFAVLFFAVLLAAVLAIPVAAAGQNASTPKSPYPSAPNYVGRQPVTLILENGTEIRGFAENGILRWA